MRLGIRIDDSGLKELRDLGGNLPKAMNTGVQRVLIELSKQVTLQIRPGGALTPHSGSLGKAWTPRGGAEQESSETPN